MPTTLHAELAARSEADGLSLNQYIVAALTRAVAGAAGSQDSQGSQGRTGLPRSVRIALVVNALVVALAAGTAIALLVHGWR